MRIAIDARAHSWAGVGRYVRNLIASLSRLDTDNQYLILLAKEDLKCFAQAAANFPSRNFQPIAVESSYYSWREQIIFWQQLNNISVDLFHFPNFNLPLLFNRPYVVTVHDITRFVFPGQVQTSLAKQVIYEIVFKKAVEHAQAIICVSDATKNDLMSLPLKLPKSLTTIYEGVEERFWHDITEHERRLIRLQLGTNDPYLLYVGVWMNHKNIPRLLAAYSLALKKYPSLKLVLTGRPQPGYVPVDQETRRLGLSSDQVLFMDHVNDQLLPALYQEAAALLFPSLYEGFGLPALEAFAGGTPVITSNVTSLPEITRGAAVYVNPESIPDIADAINLVISDQDVRLKLAGHGRQISRSFRWETCARQTLTQYKQAMSGSS